MSPAALLLVIQGIQAAISAAPQVEALIVKSKELVTTLFAAGAISAAQQDALHARIDVIAEHALRGELPPHWTVEADPV